MSEFVKQMLNREFTDAVGYTEDSVFSTFSDNIGLYFELAKSEGEDVGGTRRVPCPWSVDAVGEEEYQRRETQIVPLQIKIKEMLYSPHNRRGRAFIEKQIDWAFESD